ncbi:MAG: GH3 family domain-containing protein, partial [Planctomycetia bacterium]
IRDVYEGTVHPDFPIPDSLRKVERHRLQPNRARAKELEEIVSRTGRMAPKDVWPTLKLLGNWTGGSVGAYLRHYPDHYGAPAVRDLGLIASEGRMTIPMEDGTSGGVLEIGSTFFEFIPAGEIDAPNPTVLESHELKEGCDYFILLTTSSGLYRYNIYDVVRCVGWFNRTPILSFLNKGSNFSNLTGEKISEHHAAKAVEDGLRTLDLKLSAYALAPVWLPEEKAPYYGLFVEAGDFADAGQAAKLAALVEENLGRLNIEYEAKRESHRLQAVRAELLPTGAWKQWDQARLARTGGTAEQYKHPVLIADLEFRKSMPLAKERAAS